MLRWQVHSENTWVSVTLKRVHEGHTQFLVKSDLEFGQLFAVTNYSVSLTQLWVIFRVKLTDFRVIVDPEWSLAPMDPFSVKFEPGVGFASIVCVIILSARYSPRNKLFPYQKKHKNQVLHCVVWWVRVLLPLHSYAHLFRIQSHILLLHTRTIELQKGG